MMNRNICKIGIVALVAALFLVLVCGVCSAGYNFLPDRSTKIKPDSDLEFVRETADRTVLPRGYTNSSMLFALTLGRTDTAGLRGLAASCSAQFSPLELDFIAANAQGKRLVIVDLREDAHAFINDYSVQIPGAAVAEEEALENRLKGLKVKIAPLQYFVLSNARRDFAPVTVSEYSTEQQLCEKLGYGYYRLPQGDLRQQLLEFTGIVRDLPEGCWVHVHDSDGSKAPLFLAAFDAIKNSTKVSASDIISRNSALNRRTYSDTNRNILKNIFGLQENRE